MSQIHVDLASKPEFQKRTGYAAEQAGEEQDQDGIAAAPVQTGFGHVLDIGTIKHARTSSCR